MDPKTNDEPQVRLARDEFTVERRRLDGHPEAVKAQSRIDVEDDYGNVTTWNLDLYRKEGQVTAFVQVGKPDGYIRLLIPPDVTAALNRHFGGLVKKHRRKVARRSVADLRAASGEFQDADDVHRQIVGERGRRRRKRGKV